MSAECDAGIERLADRSSHGYVPWYVRARPVRRALRRARGRSYRRSYRRTNVFHAPHGLARLLLSTAALRPARAARTNAPRAPGVPAPLPGCSGTGLTSIRIIIQAADTGASPEVHGSSRLGCIFSATHPWVLIESPLSSPPPAALPSLLAHPAASAAQRSPLRRTSTQW